jgi:2-polyprenyl-3-methyl-5-hydroxy-6-metoxy-1,4-benzoquinol methylase
MKNWRDVSNEPNAPEVRAFLQRQLSDAYGPRVENFQAFISAFVRDRSVLDIGAVGHVVERSATEDFKHAFIKKIASRLVGIDILEEPVNHLKSLGYDVRMLDATSDLDMGERFERIVIGDVIEHVDDPVKLLKFAARHLAPGGSILCTTPNPFYIGYMVEMFRHGMVIENAEHVNFIIPSNALEIANRAGVNLTAVHHFGGGGYSPLRRGLISLLKMTGLIKYELFARSYIYIFQVAPR